MNRLFIAVAIVSAVAFIPCTECAGQSSEPSVRFAVIGDRTGGHVPGVYGQVISEIERMQPDFALTVGDMIEGYVDDTAGIMAEWGAYDSIVAPLSSKIYYTPGNHDIWSDLSEELYRRFVGVPYCSFDRDGIHFVILDVSRAESSEEIPEEQLEWLSYDLQHNQDASYTFVFYHKPFWAETTATGKRDTLHSLFTNFGVDAVFTGHYHDYFTGEFDGVLYTSVGSSGAAMVPSPTGLGYHFAWVTVDDLGIHIAPVKSGAVLAWNDVTVMERRVFNNIRRRGLTFVEPAPVTEDSAVERSELVMVLNNTSSDYELDDTLRWDVPEGWTVEPEILPVKAAGRSESTARFVVRCDGPLYPVPSASVDFVYAEGKEVTAETDIRVSRMVHCQRATSRPKIDGKLSEECWRDPVTRLFNYDGSDSKIDPVRFYFAYDADNLYIAAHCADTRIDSLYANVTEHDGAVYGEDCVGYFFEPVYGSETVYQIYLNPNGVMFDQKLWMGEDGYMDGDFDWNTEYEAETVIGDDFWSIEARIPVDQFGTKLEEGDDWRLNFRRKQRRLNSAADWQVPIEYYPDTYGVMSME